MFSRVYQGLRSGRAERLRRVDQALESAARTLGDLSILTRSLAPWRHEQKATEDQNPVVLVHGFGGDVGSLAMLARSLAHDGWRVFPLDFDTLTRPVEALADRLGGHVARVRRRLGVGRVDLVGHSLGGLITRYYIQMLGGHEVVDRVVTIGTPHAGGTFASYALHPLRWLGYLPTPRPGQVTAADQLMPGSEFYDCLNGPIYRVETCGHVDLTNIWSLADECIWPSWRARFPGATREHRFVVHGHLGLVLSGTVGRLVRATLRAAPRPPLGAREATVRDEVEPVGRVR
jgi:pimeloyl-ACP methyl ester carboxylesterase